MKRNVLGAARTSRKGVPSTRSLVGFEVAGIPYAIDIQRVKEIIRPLPVLRLPHVAPSVVGVADHRGDVVPIIDLRTRFGVDSGTDLRSHRWMIVTRQGRLAGLVVDEVTEVFGAAEAQGRKLPELGAGEEARGLVAAYNLNGRLTFVVDPDLLTSATDGIDMAQARQLLEAAHDRD